MGNVSFRATSKTFPGKVPVHALDDITLEIKDGEFVALLGPSGCGKSTLLNLLAGFETRSGGELTFDGAPVDKPGPDRGVVFQEASLFPWLNVWDNITFGPRVQGLKHDEYESKARAMLKLVGLEAFAHALPAQLSGGMRQRVGIARVLVMNPRALLMDEPFGALDAQTKLQLEEVLLALWTSERRTVVFITHDLSEAVALSDRVIVMSARPGTIIADIKVDLPRPRSVRALQRDARYHDIYAMIWSKLELALEGT
jgi:NitT/TauT family transport system ATP-binding protein